MKPFCPDLAATVNVDVGVSTGNVSLAINRNNPVQVRVMNNGSATAWVNFGGSAVTASLTTSFPVGPGVTEVVTVQPVGAILYAAAIAAGATGKIYFTPGSGV